MRKGSITVFLSLVLVLLFSFLLTTLEAARIRGATAYVSMVSELAGESFLASYYYPLFQNYRLLGVDMGDEDGGLSATSMVDALKEDVVFGMSGLKGGLLQFHGTGIAELSYKTMLSHRGAEFLSQVKQQVVLDGLSLTLNELFSEKQFTEAGVVGAVYRKQEEALTATATVTAELIKLMELVDGVRMGKNGIAFDKNGKMQSKEHFIKQLVPMEQEEIMGSYDSKEVFRMLSGGFFRADRAADRIERLISAAQEAELGLEEAKLRISEYESCLEELTKQWEEEKKRRNATNEAVSEETEKMTDSEEEELQKLESELERIREVLAAEKAVRADYENQRDNALSDAKAQHKELKKKLEAVHSLLEDALDIVQELEKKQQLAGIAVEAYEAFLEGIKPSLSEELHQVFLKELEKMQIYAGLDERGFSIEVMRRSLMTNRDLLEELSLSGFSERTLDTAREELTAVKSRMKEYTVDGLWFSYGEIVVAEQTWENVTGFLTELLTTGILSLVGIPKEEQSERSLTGTELPSAGLEKKNVMKELLDCVEEVRELFQNGSVGEVLKTAGNAALDETALELYSMKYFHRYGEESPYTKLNYEREYLIFGAEEDKSNLLAMVLYLIAIRALLCMVMIIKQPDRMAELETLSVGVAGFTGMPVLAAVVKYSVLLLWSVEEALVEVAALLQGKRIPVVSVGTVAFSELLIINKETIKSKSQRIPDGVGAAYQDYLALVSLTKTVKEKSYRALDLIQENIRYRYRDSFRIRNVVTQVSFGVKTQLKPLVDTGLFPKTVYERECHEVREY